MKINFKISNYHTSNIYKDTNMTIWREDISEENGINRPTLLYSVSGFSNEKQPQLYINIRDNNAKFKGDQLVYLTSSTLQRRTNSFSDLINKKENIFLFIDHMYTYLMVCHMPLSVYLHLSGDGADFSNNMIY
jgi:hypothetical protein